MTTQNIGLLNAIEASLRYNTARQAVIAQNISNADTPGYKPYDLVAPDFKRVLSGSGASSITTPLRPVMTDVQHLAPPNSLGDAVAQRQRGTYEVAPDKNAVILEEQMIKANKISSDYTMALNLYRKQVGMIRTALGR